MHRLYVSMHRLYVSMHRFICIDASFYMYRCIVLYVSMHRKCDCIICIHSDEIYEPRAPWQATETGKLRIHDFISDMTWPSCKCIPMRVCTSYSAYCIVVSAA